MTTTRAVLRLIALATSYVVAARLCLIVAVVNSTVAPVWLPTGIAIGALTLWGPRLWPAISMGAFIANSAIIDNPAPVAAGIAIGNTLEAVLGAMVLRGAGVGGEVSRVRDAVAVILVALAAPVPSATGGVLSLTLGNFSIWADYPGIWLIWWLGDVMGALLALPLLLGWLGTTSPVPYRPRHLEFAAVFTVTSAQAVAFTSLRFDMQAALGIPIPPYTAFLFPPMLWATLRLRPRQAAAVIASASALAAAFTVRADAGAAVGPLVLLDMVVLSVAGGSLLTIAAIAERLMAQMAQRASESRFRTIFEQAAIGITRVARDGTLLEVNDRLCEILGYRRDELVGKTFEAITVPSFLKEERPMVEDLFGGRRKSYSIDKQYLRKGGMPVWARVTSSLPDDIPPTYRITIVEDITEQRLAVAREYEAQASNRAKSTFLAAASHDLRQPVQAIVLLIGALKGRMKGKKAEEALVEKVELSVAALQTLLGALLDVSRLDAGVVVPEIKPVCLAEIIGRLGQEYAVRAAERGLVLRVVGTAAWARTDPTLLERVLRNLIENSLRYTPRGSVLVGCRRHGDGLHLQVIDTGIGIPPGQQEAIFQEFYQVANHERDREKGLGLGLSIVKRLCDLLGHELTLRSEAGRGTCVTVELPCVPRQETAAEHVPAFSWRIPLTAEKGDGHLAALVVDDDPLVRDGLAQALATWGIEVLLAADGAEAVRCVSLNGRRCPDVIIADYRLPGGPSGIDAAREVCRTCGRDIPVFIVTGDTAPERIAEAEASGFRILHKPVDFDRLMKILLSFRRPTGETAASLRKRLN